MSYTALYRKFRPAEFEDVKGQDLIINAEESDKGGQNRTCISVLWHKRNRKDNSSEDFCKGSQLRASGRRKSLRGMYHVQKYCSRYFHERH